MIPLSLREIAVAVGAQAPANPSLIVSEITTDTRKITPGCLFIPLKGERFDGHDFIEEAFQKGALCVLSEKEGFGLRILVENTKDALKSLAAYYRSLFSIPVIAITGSVGKTTTKDLIASVLEQKFHVLKTQGNFNNEIGLPLTVFQLTKEHEAAVLEMGMNHFGEIHELAKIGRPDIAVITNIGVSHIENLGSRDGILKAKSEIFDFFERKETAILNCDDDKLIKLDGTTEFGIKWYGIDNHMGLWADEINPQEMQGIFCRLHGPKLDIAVNIPVPGKHMVLNALAAAAVGLELGLTEAEIKAGIEAFSPTKMRMNIFQTNKGITVIDDAYNANPVSMKAALDVLKGAKGRKVAILGDMFELGEESASMHYDVGGYGARAGIDIILCVGSLGKEIACGAKNSGGNVRYFEKQEELINCLDSLLLQGDTVLVKASRGMHFEKTVDKMKE